MKNSILDKTVREVTDTYEGAREYLVANGFSGWDDEGIFSQTAPYLTLKNALAAKGINETLFLENFISYLEMGKKETPPSVLDIKKLPRFSALLPCGLRNPFLALFEEFRKRTGWDSETLIEGNVNHELSLYSRLEEIEDSEDLPDLMITSDINNLFHRKLRERFIDAGCFSPAPEVTSPLFKESGLYDPEGNYTFIASNYLVMVVCKDKLGDRPMPGRWEDLLSPAFHKDLGIRGEDDFYCHSVSIPYYLLYGEKGVEQLALNIYDGYHPSQMVKLIDNPKAEGPSVFIMPHFFASKIQRKERVEIIFPEEGVFTSPVTLFIKKEKAEELKDLREFLLGREMADLCNSLAFPAAYSDQKEGLPGGTRLYWIGWDRVRKGDIQDLKNKIDTIYRRVLEPV